MKSHDIHIRFTVSFTATLPLSFTRIFPNLICKSTLTRYSWQSSVFFRVQTIFFRTASLCCVPFHEFYAGMHSNIWIFFHPISSLIPPQRECFTTIFFVSVVEWNQTVVLFTFSNDHDDLTLRLSAKKKRDENFRIDYFNESNWNWMNDGIDDDTAWTHIKMRNGYCLPLNLNVKKISWA